MRKVEPREELRPLAERLRALRLARGWSMDDAARAAGTSQTTVMHAERGCMRPHLRVLSGLARVYEVPLEELVALAGREPAAQKDPALATLAARVQAARLALPGAPALYVCARAARVANTTWAQLEAGSRAPGAVALARITRLLGLDDLAADESSSARTVGYLILTARQQRGWSSSLTASRARLGHDLLVGLERAERVADADVLARLADVLGLERQELLVLAGHPAELIGDPWTRNGSRGRRPHRGWLSPGGGRQANPARAAIPGPVRTLPPVSEIRGPGARGSWDWTDWRKQAILSPSS